VVLALTMRRLLGTKAEGSTTGAGGMGVAASVVGAAIGAPQPPQSLFPPHLLHLWQLKSEASKPGRLQQDFLGAQQLAFLGAQQLALGAALGAQQLALGAAQPAFGAQPQAFDLLQQPPNKPLRPQPDRQLDFLPQQSAFGAAQLALGAAHVALGAAHVALGAAHLALGAQQLAFGAQPQSLPSSWSRSPNPKLWVHNPTLKIIAVKSMFNFIEQRLLFDGTGAA
jgi:hypothetical protein